MIENFLPYWFKKDKEINEPIVEEIVTKSYPHYVFIHGANQSALCWNYIITKLELTPDDYTALEYSSVSKFNDNLKRLSSELAAIDGDVFIVAHSLGGIYAVHLYEHHPEKIIGAITISTPYGGSKTADIVKYMVPSYSLFREIGPKSLPIASAHIVDINIPWTQLVSTQGAVPWHGHHNDGVVTFGSMRFRTDIDYVDLPVNHYEILAYEKTVELIKKLSEIT